MDDRVTRGKRRTRDTRTDESPELTRLRDRRVDAWLAPGDVQRVAELRAQAMAGDDRARRELWRLGCASVFARLDDDPADVADLLVELAASRRRWAVWEWRRADEAGRGHVQIDAPPTEGQIRETRRRRLAGLPDLTGIESR